METFQSDASLPRRTKRAALIAFLISGVLFLVAYFNKDDPSNASAPLYFVACFLAFMGLFWSFASKHHFMAEISESGLLFRDLSHKHPATPFAEVFLPWEHMVEIWHLRRWWLGKPALVGDVSDEVWVYIVLKDAVIKMDSKQDSMWFRDEFRSFWRHILTEAGKRQIMVTSRNFIEQEPVDFPPGLKCSIFALPQYRHRPAQNTLPQGNGMKPERD